MSFFISEYLPKAGKRLIFYTEKGDLNYVNKNLTKHKLLFNFISQIRQTIKCSGTIIANFAWYRRTKDSVSLFDPKVHLFENSILKILAQLDISFFLPHSFCCPFCWLFDHDRWKSCRSSVGGYHRQSPATTAQVFKASNEMEAYTSTLGLLIHSITHSLTRSVRILLLYPIWSLSPGSRACLIVDTYRLPRNPEGG